MKTDVCPGLQLLLQVLLSPGQPVLRLDQSRPELLHVLPEQPSFPLSLFCRLGLLPEQNAGGCQLLLEAADELLVSGHVLQQGHLFSLVTLALLTELPLKEPMEILAGVGNHPLVFLLLLLEPELLLLLVLLLLGEQFHAGGGPG